MLANGPYRLYIYVNTYTKKKYIKAWEPRCGDTMMTVKTNLLSLPNLILYTLLFIRDCRPAYSILVYFRLF